MPIFFGPIAHIDDRFVAKSHPMVSLKSVVALHIARERSSQCIFM
jgi:hypothetical protein